MTWVQTIFQKLAAHMTELRGADFKIAFYLVSQVVATGKSEISLSERALSDATGISLSTISVALRRLEFSGLFLREAGGRARSDRFLLPAFRPADGVPVFDTQVPRFPVQGDPISGTQVPRFPVQGDPISGTQDAPFPPAHNMERARAPVESSSFVGSSSSSIDRVLTTRTLRDDQLGEADVLRRHMRSFIGRVGDPSLDGREIDDAIVAQCLAIAPAGRLIECLTELRSRHVPPFQTLGWFVTAFAKHFMGISPAEVKSARGSLRPVRKPVNGETPDHDFNRAVIHEAVTSVRGLG